MKTEQQINDARKILCDILQTPGLSGSQRTLFAGMLNALAWAADGHNASTMDRLLAGEPIAAGKDPTKALRHLEALANDPLPVPRKE